MFNKLTERLSRTIDSLRGKGRITDENVAETVREVRMALLEADVAVPVVKRFTDTVRARALGAEVAASLTPGQTFVSIIHRELVALLGERSNGLALNASPPVVVLLAGLQGAGKTTTAGKLARWLKEQQRKKVLLVSTDVRRPAAILQLARLAEQVGVDHVMVDAARTPPEIAANALVQAQRGLYEVLIVDTAGRLHIDAELMAEVQAIDQAVQPHQRLFVVDAMSGQDALNSAREFGAALDLTGIVLTKADGDARGGAALSVREVTGKPIVFLGMGEKSEALELFDPERLAQRILGMGDVVALVEKVQQQVDVEAAEKLARKVASGKRFDYSDLRSQLEQISKMGGMAGVLEQLPAQLQRQAASMSTADRDLRRQLAIIDSMTARERRHPDLIDGSRRRRIARGAGVQVQDVNRLQKQFQDMQRMMKQMKGGKLGRMLAGFKGMGGAGGMPPPRMR
jgi:signal recognition particle subunit SRP54